MPVTSSGGTIRSWGEPREPVVVGAFPEPFLHGYGGRLRHRGRSFAVDARAREADRPAHRRRRSRPASRRLGDGNVFRIVRREARFSPSGERPRRGLPVRFVLAAPIALAAGAAARPGPLSIPCREPGPRRRTSRRARGGRAAGRRTWLGRRDRGRPARRLPARTRGQTLGSTSRARSISASALFVLSPVSRRRSARTRIWTGPIVPVLGTLDVTRKSSHAALKRCVSPRSASRSRPMRSCSTTTGSCRRRVSRGVRCSPSRWRPGCCRRSSATRPGSSRRCAGRGVEVTGVRGRAPSALAARWPARSSAALNLAEAMEARGFGRPGRTRSPKPAVGVHATGWRSPSAFAVVAGALWL